MNADYFAVILQNYHQLLHIVTHRTDMGAIGSIRFFFATTQNHQALLHIQILQFNLWLGYRNYNITSPVTSHHNAFPVMFAWVLHHHTRGLHTGIDLLATI